MTISSWLCLTLVLGVTCKVLGVPGLSDVYEQSHPHSKLMRVYGSKSFWTKMVLWFYSGHKRRTHACSLHWIMLLGRRSNMTAALLVLGVEAVDNDRLRVSWFSFTPTWLWLLPKKKPLAVVTDMFSCRRYITTSFTI